MHSALRPTARYTCSANHPSPATSSDQEVNTAEAKAKKTTDAEVADTKKAHPKGAKKKGGFKGKLRKPKFTRTVKTGAQQKRSSVVIAPSIVHSGL